ncbi:hypothetical protein N6L24_04475 [Cognatishimia sp. SS12]|uniref:hypothetical protein n=1 Tax=Cognatishimia sp. SS12 TaxID=2979465 RepID=UPI00233089C6|nr:hypothetical protein [Cognatishimia sp. SS12]MDC0737521.1 hypothetical protein [Cognatishimia sp. SS12]
MDITQLGAIVGLATSAVGLTDKATSTVASIKELFEDDKTPDNSEAAKLLNALAGELTSVNMMNVQLSTMLKTLTDELQKEGAFAAESARYELFETGQGVMIYRLKESEANGEPIHYICPVCLKRDKLVSYVDGRGDYKICQTNRDHFFQFDHTPMRQPKRTRGTW